MHDRGDGETQDNSAPLRIPRSLYFANYAQPFLTTFNRSATIVPISRPALLDTMQLL